MREEVSQDMALKNLNLNIPGSGESRQIAVEENTTVADVLEQMNLSDFEVNLGDGKPPLSSTFRLHDLPENATLYAATPPTAGITL